MTLQVPSQQIQDDDPLVVFRLGKTWKNKEFLTFLISIYFVFFFLLFISKIETITKGTKLINIKNNNCFRE